MTSTSTLAPAALKPCHIYMHFIHQKLDKQEYPDTTWQKLTLKTTDILRCCHWFPCEMMSEEQAQKFYTKDMSLSRPGQWLLIGWSKFPSWQHQSEALVTQIRVVTHHQYGMSVFVPQTSFRGERSGGVAKYLLFSQARLKSWCKDILQ